MAMVLIPIDGGRPIPLDKAIVFFGRGSDCDVVLSSSRKISRKHCCVAQIDDHYLIRDLGSMNGLRVNDDPVVEEAPIEIGDEVWVGDFGFIFQAMKLDRKNKKPKKDAKKPLIDPKMLSLDIPVAIPEQSDEFIIEESIIQPAIVESDEDVED